MSEPDLLYRAYCGKGNTLVAEVEREHIAVAIATAHEEAHRCGAWWERPFDHVAFYAPNACDPPSPQG
jgi:hypothetical protein